MCQVWAAYDTAGEVCLGGGQIDSTDRLGMLLPKQNERIQVLCLFASKSRVFQLCVTLDLGVTSGHCSAKQPPSLRVSRSSCPMNRVRSYAHAKCRVGHAAMQAPTERAEAAVMLPVEKAPL